MRKPLVYTIQKFSIHDGPGIRTTIFFKGCPLRCKWCHNPESLRYEEEDMRTERGGVERIGKYYTVNELVAAAEADKLFYQESGGGVTLSGGEVLSQDLDYIEDLCRKIRSRGMDLAIDTSGYVPFSSLERVMPYASLFLYDFKALPEATHKASTGVSNRRILENLERLSASGAAINLRMIMVEEINAARSDIEASIKWLDEHKIRPVQINLLPYHEFGSDKYVSLGLSVPPIFKTPSPERIVEIQAAFESAGHVVKIGG